MDDYYQRIYADPDVMRTLPSGKPLSREAFNVRIPTFMVDHWNAHGFGPWIVIHKSDQQCIGHCGLRYWPGSFDVEVLYALDKRYWGRGLATEGARASLRYGFAEPHLDRIMAAALVDNHASRQVIAKLGMQYEKNLPFSGLEVACYAIIRADYIPDDAVYRLA